MPTELEKGEQVSKTRDGVPNNFMTYIIRVRIQKLNEFIHM